MRELTPNESESTTQHKKNVVHNNYYGDLIPIGTVFGTRIQWQPICEGVDKVLEDLQFENVKTNENSRLKGNTNGVEPMQSQSSEMQLPLKSFKKRIKVEKIWYQLSGL